MHLSLRHLAILHINISISLSLSIITFISIIYQMLSGFKALFFPDFHWIRFFLLFFLFNQNSPMPSRTWAMFFHDFLQTSHFVFFFKFLHISGFLLGEGWSSIIFLKFGKEEKKRLKMNITSQIGIQWAVWIWKNFC